MFGWVKLEGCYPRVYPHPRIKYEAGSSPRRSGLRGFTAEGDWRGLGGFMRMIFEEAVCWGWVEWCVLVGQGTLTPVSSTGQALALSRQGRGDKAPSR